MSEAESRRVARLAKHETKKKLRRQKKASRLAERQAQRAAVERTAAAKKIKTRPVQMQKDTGERIADLRNVNRALEKKIVALKGLLGKAAPPLAATI